jgi:uncharacterized protein YdhG (YjbR/CyaY superfamily)
MSKFETISAYIEACPADQQAMLQQMRTIIRKIVPAAEERISYGMPTFKLKGNLVHFASAKKHIGLYPGASAIEAFQEELARYKTFKGTIQLPVDQELPIRIIEKILHFRVAEQTKSI